jgi:hypothetical protein
MMNYPDDVIARSITDQFMLGDHILMAPIFEEGQMFINLYLPTGTWRHLWTGQVFNGPTKATVYAPIGKPAVFFDDSWVDGKDLYNSIRNIPKPWISPYNQNIQNQTILAT